MYKILIDQKIFKFIPIYFQTKLVKCSKKLHVSIIST